MSVESLSPGGKERISLLQYLAIAITSVISTADTFLPSFVAQDAKQDAWVSVIIATIFALLVAAIFLTLGLRFPNKTVVEYSTDILGKPLGKIIGFIFVYYFLEVAWLVTRELGALYLIAFNPDAPMTIYNVLIVILAAYALTMGLEVIGRITEILLFAGLLVLGSIAFFNIANIDLKNFLPILSQGIKPPLKGAVSIQGWLLEMVLILQFIPYTMDKNKIKKYSFLAIILLFFSLELGTLMYTIFGPLTGAYFLPALQYIRFASIGEYFRNLEITIMAVWITGIFIKIAVFYYAGTVGLAQLCGFKSYKPLIVPVGMVIAIFSIAVADNFAELSTILHDIFPFSSLIVGFIIPLLLLLVAVIRGKRGEKVESEQSTNS